MALRRIIVNTGERFSSLTVIRETIPKDTYKHKKRMVLCKCDCGEEITVRLEYLRNGHTKSCGCRVVEELLKHRKTHGSYKTRLYGIWTGMKNRCSNPNVKSFKNYGKLGVTVCEEWNEFHAFYTWAIENGYEEHLTIERKNPFGNYEPSNCTWIPKEEQSKNRRSNFEPSDEND